MSLIDDIEKKVSDTFHDVTSTGAPAVIAGIENYAADQLKGMAQKNQNASQAAVQQVLAQPGPSSGIMASINNVMSEVAQGAFFKQYGGWIILGMVATVIIVKKVF